MFLNKFLKTFVKIGTLHIITAEDRLFQYVGNSQGPAVTLKFQNKQIERQLFWNPELALGEGYMNGSLTIEKGTLYDLLDLCTQNISNHANDFATNPNHKAFLKKLFPFFAKSLRLLQQYNPVKLAKKHISHHYDMSNEFIDLFLDPDRQYSCAYFKSEEDSLTQAQENKKQHIAKKLLLQSGQNVLDIGSGWGGLGLYLAKAANVNVVGLTLSKEQHAVSNQRALEANLSQQVQFHLRDYREETAKYDRIVSVGMFEHVGTPHYVEFFQQVHRLLKDDGVMLLHAIGSSGPPRTTNAWIRKYIFPGGYCPSLSEVLPIIENTKLIVTDIEILRLHYAETLKAWRENFLKNIDKAKTLYNDTFCRMWEYYLTSCEMGFRNQELMVFQIQLSKKKDAVPITRDYISK